MSRSYKSVPHWSCKERGGFHKNQANRTVRRNLDIQSGGSYQKLYERWDICDWIWIGWTKQQVRDWIMADDKTPERTLLKYIMK